MIKHIIYCALGLTLAVPLSAESLYVFIPTEVRANALQASITEVCSNVDVTVFGRAKDFQKKVSAEPPSAIMSLLPVVESSAGFSISGRGELNSATEASFVLVSVDEPIDITTIGTKKIGVVDILGRKPMVKFVSELFKTPVKLKRVTKVEDLLPLLNFGAVDGIFISDTLFQALKSKSNLNLVSTPLDIKIGLAAVAVKDAASKSKITECVSKFNSDLNNTIGVDKWRAQ
jgi:hypothetical protein